MTDARELRLSLGTLRAVVDQNDVIHTATTYTGIEEEGLQRWQPVYQSFNRFGEPLMDPLVFAQVRDSLNAHSEVYDLCLDDELFYTWSVDEDTVSFTDSVMVTFEELGDPEVRCIVSDGDLVTVTRWLIHVRDIFIDSHEPAERELMVRRGESVDFNIGVQVIENVQVDYLWTLTDLRTRRDSVVAETDSVSLEFPLVRNYRLEASASTGAAAHEFTWTIFVRSTVWAWYPRSSDITVELDSTVTFWVMPNNSESDSLSFLWRHNGDFVSADSFAVVTFDARGQREVTAIVHDGADADTLLWRIDVMDSVVAVRDELAVVPEQPSLRGAVPNPFNSITTVRFSLPAPERVYLSVFDVRGREVAVLAEGQFVAGHNGVEWNATDFSSGVYFCRIQAGDFVGLKKVMLMR